MPTCADTVTLPSALVWTNDTPLVTFAAVPIAALAAPFLADALAQGRVVRFEPLDAFDRDDRDLRFAGAIHHMSRCGSTALCRQFAAVSRVVALSEPFIVQHLLEGPAAPAALVRTRLRLLAAAWRDGLAPIADRIVVKWPMLVAQHAATIVDAFPETPTLFLHRAPVDVLASIARAPLGGAHLVRARHVLGGRVPADPLAMWAGVLARTCRTAAEAPGLRSVDYTRLPAIGWQEVARYFGIAPSPTDLDAMRAASLRDAKDPTRAFVPDTAAKRAESDAHVLTLAETILAPALAHLRDRMAVLDEADA